MSRNVARLNVSTPRTMPAPKVGGGFRIVHQLDPIDAIVYTALAYEIAEKVELVRPAIDDKVACSYRLAVGDASFFAGGSGYADFVSQTERLASDYKYILNTDITDFYNQINLHRLNNNIEFADVTLKGVADDIEDFVSRINVKTSQGVPVGPAASIVMAETVMVDIDRKISNMGFPHTRYVDDIRIFSKSKEDLVIAHQDLCLYLYKNHRLTLSSEKTGHFESAKFVEKRLHNPYVEERTKFFRSLEIFNPYTQEVEKVELPVIDNGELIDSKLNDIIDRILEYSQLDLGLIRSVLRRARQHRVVSIADKLLPNFERFTPVINDMALYLAEISDDQLADHWAPIFATQIQGRFYDCQIVRFWMEWFMSKSEVFLDNDVIRRFLANSPNFVHRASAAITTRDIAWVRDHRDQLANLGNWERRALLNAARILPTDERRPWLQLAESNLINPLDKWTAKWVRETT